MTFKKELRRKLAEAASEVSSWSTWEKEAIRHEIGEYSSTLEAIEDEKEKSLVA